MDGVFIYELSMKFSKHLMVTFCLIFLMGQEEYRYSYCEMAKHVVDAPMLQQCAHAHQNLVGQPYSGGIHRMPFMKVIAKISTDNFDRVLAFTPPVGMQISAVPLRPVSPLRPLIPFQPFDLDTAFPDLHLSNCCFRL